MEFDLHVTSLYYNLQRDVKLVTCKLLPPLSFCWCTDDCFVLFMWGLRAVVGWFGLEVFLLPPMHWCKCVSIYIYITILEYLEFW